MAAAFVNINQERHNRRALRRQRVFRDRQNPLELDDIEIFNKYRLPRQVILDLIETLETDLLRTTQRSCALSVVTQVFTSLRYFASGSFYLDVGDNHGISKASVSRALHRVTAAIISHAGNYINFSNEPNFVRILKASFYEIAGMPNVIGLIDGTMIPIKAPNLDEFTYVCRKGYHALNVQIVCGPSMEILDVVSKYAGSAHDSFVWGNCGLQHLLENGDFNGGYLLGDSGYPLKPYLLTPVMNATTRPQQRYNSSHKRTRCLVERCIGVLKSRFRCLDKSGGTMQFAPNFCAQIIVACTILHNICIQNRVPTFEFEEEFHPDEEEQEDVLDHLHEQNEDGQTVRENLIATRF